jgi:glycine dehydrogenase subunit 2
MNILDILPEKTKYDQTTVRPYHQAQWNERLIFELNEPGQRGVLVPEAEVEIRETIPDPLAAVPEKLRRKQPPALPEISQVHVLRHYLRLSQETLGAGLVPDFGMATSTMKYNPPINEQLARSPKISKLHPLQYEDTVQGILELIYRFEQILKEISGMARFSFQPRAGSHAIYTNASIVRAYHAARGEAEHRDEVITTILAHPSDAACPATAGYNIITLYPEENGYPSLEAIQAAVSERTAALFTTNPDDTGIFNPIIDKFVEVVHVAGGLCSYDQANANGLLGIARAADAGFDLCHFNLHKTFSTPHGSGGPGAGACGVTESLVRYLPIPTVEFDGNKYYLDYDRPDSIGKVSAFYGNVPNIVRAYAWVMALGADGMREAAEVAVLNNNYLMKKVLEIPGITAPYAKGKRRIEQVRYSIEELTKETGVNCLDFALRVADFAAHGFLSHHPFVVPEPLTLEPTESYSKTDIDEYAATWFKVANEARYQPELVKTAPHQCAIHQVTEHDSFEDPDHWAITWRAYQRKSKVRDANK